MSATPRGEHEVDVPAGTTGRLAASLLDAKTTFDRLVQRYAPTPADAERILKNRFYSHLSGTLAGVLEYMAVERLFEVASEGRFDRVVLDTPPTRQAIDFLEAPQRIVGFLDSGALSDRASTSGSTTVGISRPSGDSARSVGASRAGSTVSSASASCGTWRSSSWRSGPFTAAFAIARRPSTVSFAPRAPSLSW